ncbi:hypothetical protein VTK26DRAFT_4054 [Humicola hyalothermophila]
MAPAAKRSPSTEGMEPDADSGPQNSITVAGAIAARASSEISSPRTSPAATTDSPANEAVMTANAGQPNSDRQNGPAVPLPVAAAPRSASYDYEFSDIDEITMRQLNEDILAYNYDLDYCRAQLEEADLTPQETRTLQLRILDLGHQIRHCKHRIEILKVQTRKRAFHPAYGGGSSGMGPPAATLGNGTRGQRHANGGTSSGGLVPVKRTGTAAAAASRSTLTPGKRPSRNDDDDDDDDDDDNDGGDGGNGDDDGVSAKRVKTAVSPDPDLMAEEGVVNTSLQRLGLWKCRLCSAPKYLLAGAGRSPAAPCKWPLKDISKMITHFTEMHAEHTPAERCAELGAALTQNRGPFEYWLRRTRAQNISDPSVIDDCLVTLLNGEMPGLLRRHSRAAAGMLTR